MKLLGVTGGVGMGKTTVAQCLRAAGVAVVDTDELARQVVEPGQPAWEEIRAAFGPQFIGSDGRLRRAELGRLVFGDATARAKLEAIVHPRIRALWQAAAAAWRLQGRSQGAVIIPLLYETAAAPLFNAVLCVACSRATQQQRLASRGWPEGELERRNGAQWPVEKKMALADFVIWNEGSLEVLTAQLQRVLAVL